MAAPFSMAMKLAIFPAALGAGDVAGAQGRQEDGPVGFVHPAQERDLLEREAGGLRFLRRHEGRPELRGDAAFAQAGNVGVAGIAALVELECGDVALDRRIVADDPGQVVVAVDERRPVEKAKRVGEGGIGHAARLVRSAARRLFPRRRRRGHDLRGHCHPAFRPRHSIGKPTQIHESSP